MPEDKYLFAVYGRKAADKTAIVVDEAVAVQLLEVRAHKVNEILKVRPLRVASQLYAVHSSLRGDLIRGGLLDSLLCSHDQNPLRSTILSMKPCFSRYSAD